MTDLRRRTREPPFRPRRGRQYPGEGFTAQQADLDAWLHHDNRERPRLGYRNQGRRPRETVERFVRQEGQEDTSWPDMASAAVNKLKPWSPIMSDLYPAM